MTQIGAYLRHDDETNGHRILQESYESQLQEYEKVSRNGLTWACHLSEKSLSS